MTCFIVLIMYIASKVSIVFGIPSSTLNELNVADKFQNSLQQQTFHSILLAIEERLRNLDNIYSMQLSETLKSKLDQYHRKLESLDTKIIRLESMVMLNLDKISENISTKNYKDDIDQTQNHRKMDNMYDGLSHRMNYMDRKIEKAFDKIQTKLETTQLRLDKFEENIMQRNSDIEADLSETLLILDDFKTASVNTENIQAVTDTILNSTLTNTIAINAINISVKHLIKELNNSLNVRLEKLDKTSLATLNATKESNIELNTVKLELKDDFNDYANKVADMNTDIWKRNDWAESTIKTIETVVNSTKIEVQNGIRSLMVQIGKNFGKELTNNEKSLEKTIKSNLEKILSNQGLFLESCHRLQMDESQIESEISVMLDKLINMLEVKMTTVMKDLKNLDKTVKNHDSKTTRNIYQANTNIVSLFEKTTKNYEFSEKELQEIKFYINSLFTFVQGVLPKNTDSLQSLSVNLTNLIQFINNTNTTRTSKLNKLENSINKYYEINNKILEKLNTLPQTIQKNGTPGNSTISQKIIDLLEDIKNDLQNLNNRVFNTDALDETRNEKPSSGVPENSTAKNKKCLPNYLHLIDVRSGTAESKDCNENISEPFLPSNKKANSKGSDIYEQDILLNNQQNKNQKNSKTNIGKQNNQIDDEKLINQNIWEIFGYPTTISNAPLASNKTSKLNLKSSFKPTNRTIRTKKKCKNYGANLIDIRAPVNSNNIGINCTENDEKPKRRKIKTKLRSRFNEDDTSEDDLLEYEEITESTIGSTSEGSSTATTTESITKDLFGNPTENTDIQNSGIPNFNKNLNDE